MESCSTLGTNGYYNLKNSGISITNSKIFDDWDFHISCVRHVCWIGQKFGGKYFYTFLLSSCNMRGRSGSVPRRWRITPISDRVCSTVWWEVLPLGPRPSSTSLRQNGHQLWPLAQARPTPPVCSTEAMNSARKTLSPSTHSALREFCRHNFPVRHISELIAMWSCSMARGDCGKADDACMYRVLLTVSQAPSFHPLPTGFVQTISNHSCTYLLQLHSV
jgi:hypothetical protein